MYQCSVQYMYIVQVPRWYRYLKKHFQEKLLFDRHFMRQVFDLFTCVVSRKPSFEFTTSFLGRVLVEL